jgi:hypothetical protein
VAIQIKIEDLDLDCFAVLTNDGNFIFVEAALIQLIVHADPHCFELRSRSDGEGQCLVQLCFLALQRTMCESKSLERAELATSATAGSLVTMAATIAPSIKSPISWVSRSGSAAPASALSDRI